MLTRRTAATLVAAGLMGLFAGCNKSDSTTSSVPPPGAGGPPGGGRVEEVEPFLAGKKVFNASCARCHSTTLGDGGGVRPGGGKGPNLSRVGANPEHTAQWLAEFIKAPMSKRENARMPAFGNLPEADLNAVAEFLASLK